MPVTRRNARYYEMGRRDGYKDQVNQEMLVEFYYIQGYIQGVLERKGITRKEK